MNCIECNNEFERKTNSQKICSDECFIERKRRKEKEHYRKYREKILLKTKEYQSSYEYKESKKKYDKKRREEKREYLNEYDRKRRDNDFYGGNRNAALEMDKYKCQMCNSKDNLVVHHIDGSGTGKNQSRSEARKANNSLDNLQTLCRSCHMKVHKEDICKKI